MMPLPRTTADGLTPPASKPEPGAESHRAAPAGSGRWLMLDLLLVGLVAALSLAAAITAGQRWQRGRACNRAAQELTASVAAIQSHFRQRGVLPPDSKPGEVPGGLDPFLAGVDWTQPTPLGGFYRWTISPATQPRGASAGAGQIALVGFPPGPPLEFSTADLLQIDRLLDDGNLSTGNFRTGFNGWPVLTVRVSP